MSQKIMNSEEAFALVCETLKNLGVGFKAKEGERTALVPVEGDKVAAHIAVDDADKVIAISAYAALSVPEQKKGVLALAVAKLNLRSAEGNFIFDYNTGSLMFYSAIYYGDGEISAKLIERKLLSCCGAMTARADFFINLCDELITPAEALQLVEEDK